MPDSVAPGLSLPTSALAFTLALVRRAPWVVLLGACACQAPRSHAYDAVDVPVPIPEGDPVVKPEQATSATVSPDVASECGRGTGRNDEGTCVALAVRDVGYAQRVQIPGGQFIMGHVPSQGYDARDAIETPAVRWSGNPPRHVEVDDFWIDLTEVPVQAYDACVARGDCTAAACPDGSEPSSTRLEAAEKLRPQLPQTCVTHEQAETFCRAHGGRLPSEAEWEYAARGVDARIYPWGNAIKDELATQLVPVVTTQIDSSYFGIVGMGSNAAEWVGEVYDADAGLRAYLSREFRRANGPAARTRARFERELACGEQPAADCQAPLTEPVRHVVKGSIAGERRAARAVVPAHTPERELEGWNVVAHGNMIGFRCAADFGTSATKLSVPTPAPPIPVIASAGGLDVFGGVAEAVDRQEAQSFCKALRVPVGEKVHEDWRLPTLVEVQAAAEVFRGPGPFWTKSGAVAQTDPRELSSAWAAVDAARTDALAARCVRSP